MSYNEEGLIRVKRGGCASKKHQDDEEERVELQDLPTPPPEQVPEVRPSSIILEEMPLVFPCSTKGFEDLQKELEKEKKLHLFDKIKYLILEAIPCQEHYTSLIPTSTSKIEHLVENIIERSYYVLRSIKNNNWNEYGIEAHRLGDLYGDLNHYLQEVARQYNENLDVLFREEGLFESNEENDKVREMAKKYQKPAGRQNEQKLEFVLLTHEAIRNLEVEHVMEEFINNIMPHARIALNRNGLKNDIVDLIRGIILTGFISRSEREQSASLLVYEQRMKSIFNDLLKELINTNPLESFRMINTGNYYSHGSDDNAPTSPTTGSRVLLDTLKVLTGELCKKFQHIQKAKLCGQLKESENQQIDHDGQADELRVEINTILSEHREHDIEREFGFWSPQHTEAMEERDALQQIIRDLSSQDKVIVQKAISDAQKNKTVQQMRAEKNALIEELKTKISHEEFLELIVQAIAETRARLDDTDRNSPEYNSIRQSFDDLREARLLLGNAIQNQEDIQQVLVIVKQNKTVQQMLDEKKLILITPTCKPFKDSHDKKDDHDDSNGGHGGNDPKPGPSGERASSPASGDEKFLQLKNSVNEVIDAMEEAKDDMGRALSANIHFENAKANYEHFDKLSEIGLAILFLPQYVIRSGVAWSNYREAARSGDATLSATNAKLIDVFNKIDNVVHLATQIEQEDASQDILTSARKIKSLERVQKLFDLVKYIDDHQAYDYVQDGAARDAARQEVNNLKTLLSKINTVVDKEIDSYAHLHNSIIQKISHAATDIVTSTKKYHLAEADAAMKVGNLEDARKHAESAKKICTL